MNTHVTRRILGAFFAVMLFAFTHNAYAGLFRAYLSVNGNDANPCTVAAPCRLLPAALAAVNDGGEVWMLDSGNFNTGTVLVSKSVTILAIPGALGSIVANGGDAIAIDTAGVKVTLRNLNVLSLSAVGSTGINMFLGAALTVENCEIYGVQTGFYLSAANSVVAIRNTVIRGTMYGMNMTGALKATLDSVHLLNSASTGLIIANGPSVLVNNSVVAGNTVGIHVAASGTTVSRLLVANSMLNANSTGIYGATGAAADVVSIMMERNVMSGNVNGVNANAATSSTLTVVLDGNALNGNANAIIYVSPAVVYSRGNNSAKLNFVDVTGPALTLLAGR